MDADPPGVRDFLIPACAADDSIHFQPHVRRHDFADGHLHHFAGGFDNGFQLQGHRIAVPFPLYRGRKDGCPFGQDIGRCHLFGQHETDTANLREPYIWQAAYGFQPDIVIRVLCSIGIPVRLPSGS